MTNPPQGGPPPGEPGGPQPWPHQSWPQQSWPQQSWPQQPGSPQGSWGPPVPGAYGGRPPSYGQPPYWVGQPPHGQPPHGQPPYGPPPRQRPQRTWIRTVLGLVALAGLLVLAVVSARLLGDTVLDRRAVERDVAEQFEERYGVGVDLDCPEEMTVEPEAVYRCTGTTGDGEDVTLEIRITDVVRAAYTWAEL